MDGIKVGVIGAGALGRHHARLYNECENAQLVGLYDTNPETAERVAEEVGTEVFQSSDELVAATEALSVAVPTNLHYELVKSLLEKGRHVLVEKPITETVQEARELVQTAKAKQLVLHVGHVEKYNPVLSCLDRVPGPPRFIEAHRLAAYPPPRPGQPPRGTEVSVVLDLMIHDLDILLDLVRSTVRTVEAVGIPVLSPTSDLANVRLVFENGCVANLTASRVSADQLRKIRVFKPSAYLSLDYGNHKGEIAYKEKLKIAREEVPVYSANALKSELEEFCECIHRARKEGAIPESRVSGDKGLAALELAHRVMQSIKTNPLD
ncbi:MAG: Gfo/Idh/MocA family oxidoreductase [Lentisphaeria bacterium]